MGRLEIAGATVAVELSADSEARLVTVGLAVAVHLSSDSDIRAVAVGETVPVTRAEALGLVV